MLNLKPFDSDCPDRDFSCRGCFTGTRSCEQSIEPEMGNMIQTKNKLQLSSIYPAIIVTGSYNDNERSAELLRMDGSSLCSLPDLPEDHRGHTQSGPVTCGGFDSTKTSCFTLTSEGWKLSHSLIYQRYFHSVWSSPLGVILMGGKWGSGMTTELLTDDGKSTELFPLKYDTEYSSTLKEWNISKITPNFRGSCSIQLEVRWSLQH